MHTVTVPTRSFLEEMFPTTARFQLDDRCRRELRCVAEYTRMLLSITDTTRGINVDATKANPLHHNTIVAELRRATAASGTETTDAAILQAVGCAVAGADDAGFDYYLRSFTLMQMDQLVGHVNAGVNESGQQVLWLDIPRNLQCAAYCASCLADLSVRQAVTRAIPMVRFAITEYLMLRFHWGELDADGAPRVSCDGYRNI